MATPDFVQQIMNFFNPLYFLLFLFGAALLAVLFQLFVLTTWKRIEGKVLESYLESKKGKKKILYSPVIKYSYNYNNNEYVGRSGWILNLRSSNFEGMKKIVDGHAPGNSVMVVVNPLIPSQSNMLSDVKPFHWILIVTMLISGILIIALLKNGFSF